jgi:membrane protein DedA with SNARE-associated domain
MSLLSPDAVHLIGRYGYGAVALAVGIESMGIPFPGETMLLAASVYAGTTHRLSVTWVIAAAAVGAIVGDNIGFWIGRELGYRFLLRYGRYVRITGPRIKLGQYVFLRHGSKVVFFGRFVPVLRTLAAFLAGANRMTWPRFLATNAAGGIAWAAAYGAAAYYFGKQVHNVLGPVGIGLLAVTMVVVIGGFFVLRRHERQLEEKAERALPGPLVPARLRRQQNR